MNVLVAYATRYGSTREVAEAVAGVLRARGADVELRAAREVRGPAGSRDLIVVGAPIYSGRWHRDAHRFLKRHRKELASVPVAVFGMGPRHPDDQAWQRSRDQLDRALARHGWLTPVAVAVFGGADPPKPSQPRRDLRNWTQIEAWAASIEARGNSAAPADSRPATAGPHARGGSR